MEIKYNIWHIDAYTGYDDYWGNEEIKKGKHRRSERQGLSVRACYSPVPGVRILRVHIQS